MLFAWKGFICVSALKVHVSSYTGCSAIIAGAYGSCMQALLSCTVECNNHRYCSNVSLCGHFKLWCFILLWLCDILSLLVWKLFSAAYFCWSLLLWSISAVLKKKRIQIFPIRILLGRIVVAGLSPLCLPLAMEPTPPAQQSRWVSVCVCAHVLSVVPLCCINPQIHACLFGIAFDPKP